MINWPVEKEYIQNLGNEPIGPVWISINKDESRQKFKEKISDHLYRTGASEALLNELLSSIQNAKQMICVCTFILSEQRIVEALLKVSSRGVDIYLLTASEKRLKDESHARTDFETEEIRLHKDILNRLAGNVLVRTAPCFHAKFLLIDPKDPKNRSGFVLSPNLARNTFAEKLELGLRLKSEEVVEIFKQFLIGFWNLSEHELLVPNRIRSKSDFTLLYQGQKASYLPKTLYTLEAEHNLQEKILDLIDNSSGSIFLSSFSFEKDHKVIDRIKEVAKTREVTVFARPRFHVMDTLIELSDQNIHVYGHPGLHAKGILSFDSGKPIAIFMTANFETKGLDEGFETGIYLSDQRAQELLKTFQIWQKSFPVKLKTKLRRNAYLGEFTSWKGVKIQTKRIEVEKIVELGSFRVNSFKELEMHQPKMSNKINPNLLYQKIVYRWKNLPPILPSKCEFLEKKKNLEIFTKGDSRYIVISKPKEYDKALKLIEEENAMIVVKE